jgi:hypothetical protein
MPPSARCADGQTTEGLPWNNQVKSNAEIADKGSGKEATNET